MHLFEGFVNKNEEYNNRNHSCVFIGMTSIPLMIYVFSLIHCELQMSTKEMKTKQNKLFMNYCFPSTSKTKEEKKNMIIVNAFLMRCDLRERKTRNVSSPGYCRV